MYLVHPYGWVPAPDHSSHTVATARYGGAPLGASAQPPTQGPSYQPTAPQIQNDQLSHVGMGVFLPTGGARLYRSQSQPPQLRRGYDAPYHPSRAAYPPQLPRSYVSQQPQPPLFSTRVSCSYAPVLAQLPPPIPPQPPIPQTSSQRSQHSRRHSARVEACCPACGKAYPRSHQHHPLPAPGEFPGVDVCSKCKMGSLPTGSCSDDDVFRGRHVTSDDHSIQVVKKGGQVQIRIFSDAELNGQKPKYVQHPKSAKRAGSVPARPKDREESIPTWGFGPNVRYTSRRRSPHRRKSPSRPPSLPAWDMRDSYAGGTGSSPADTNTHRIGYPPQIRLRGGDRHLLALPVEHQGTPHPQRETHGDNQVQHHDGYPGRSHHRYDSAGTSGPSLRPTGSPTYKGHHTYLIDLQDPKGVRWQRRGSCGSTGAVVGSPHVHFEPGASQREINVSDRSNSPRRRRTYITDEIDSILGPDSDGEGKGENSMRDHSRSDTSYSKRGDESTVSPSFFSSDSRDSHCSQSYRPPYVRDESDDDPTPVLDQPPGKRNRGRAMYGPKYPERTRVARAT